MPKRVKTKRNSILKHPEIIPTMEMVYKAHKEYTESMNNDKKVEKSSARFYDVYERIRE